MRDTNTDTTIYNLTTDDFNFTILFESIFLIKMPHIVSMNFIGIFK